jgi:AraC-like DNA-binding protein
MTPIECCRRVRIARARELLEGGDTSEKQIAQSLGYKDVASFARAFRKAVGSAPGAYRKPFRNSKMLLDRAKDMQVDPAVLSTKSTL